MSLNRGHFGGHLLVDCMSTIISLMVLRIAIINKAILWTDEALHQSGGVSQCSGVILPGAHGAQNANEVLAKFRRAPLSCDQSHPLIAYYKGK